MVNVGQQDVESGYMGGQCSEYTNSYPLPPSAAASARGISSSGYAARRRWARGMCGGLPAIVAVLVLIVVSLVAVVLIYHVQLRQQQSNHRAVLRDLESLQSTVELVSNEQALTAANIKSLTASVDSYQRSAAESFDAKIGSAKSQLSAFQSEIANLRSSMESHAAALDRIGVLEGQVEMFRRMFGLGSDPHSPPPPPDGGGGVGHAARQQMPAGQFRPGGLPQHQQVGSDSPPNNVAPPPELQQQQFPAIDRARDLPDETKQLPETERNRARADSVKREIQDSWDAYRQYAWGHDELCPNTKRHKDWGGSRSRGLALTAVDSLSTLWIAGLRNEFDEAVKLVTQYVDYDQDISVSVFETTIRVVGGLLSAYELSGETVEALLSTAVYVMDKLLPAFNTSSGIPHQTVNLKTHEHWNAEWSNGASILSEFGSVQLELRTLSFHTRNPVYDQKATHLIKLLEAKCQDMVCPTLFDVASGEARSDHITLGALGDSYYEYLVKQYVLTDRSEGHYRDMAVRALDALHVRLFRYSSPSHQGYFGESVDGSFDYKMDHLACFAGGMYALASTIASPPSGGGGDAPRSHQQGGSAAAARSQTFRKIAVELTETCFQMYDTQASGIAPEIVEFAGGQDFRPGEAYYLLRPEAVESIFYLWRMTKDEKYRTYQWKIFQHVKAYCKSSVSNAYSGVTMVSIVPPEQDDLMQSFWLAETLKYIYLTFSDDSALDLDRWVLNTEAHPLKIRRRDPLDIWREWEDEHGGTMPWLPPTLDGVEAIETERMLQARLLEGPGFRRIPRADPLGSDMRSMEGDYSDPDARVPYDPNENIFRMGQPTRHDAKWRKAQRISKALETMT